MDYLKTYEFWKNDPFFDEATRAELAALTDEKEIKERFYKDLEFGTGGLRGIIGAGSNRINKSVRTEFLRIRDRNVNSGLDSRTHYKRCDIKKLDDTAGK